MQIRLSLLAVLFSVVLVTGCNILPPGTPEAPRGPAAGDVGVKYEFSAVATDPQNLLLRYQFDWGDESETEWSQYVPSGEPVTMAHAWRTAGVYGVRVRTQNLAGRQSELSPRHVITIGSQSGYPDSVIATISTGVGSGPVGIDVTPDGRFLYVACRGQRVVRVYRTSDNTLVASVTVGGGAYDVCILPNGLYAYVPNISDRNVSVIRLSDNTVIATVPVSSDPIHCEALPNSQYVYVSNQAGNVVSVIRTDSNKVVASVPVAGAPWGLALSKEGTHFYVSCSGSDRLAKIRISDNTVTGYVTVHSGPEGICLTPDGEYFYVACYGGGDDYIDIVSTRNDSVVASIPISGRPCVVILLPGSNYIYYAAHDSGQIGVISTETRHVVWSTGYFSGACYMAALPDGSRAYLCALHEDHVIVLGK
jgi:YVTN family beta-propeller protein